MTFDVRFLSAVATSAVLLAAMSCSGGSSGSVDVAHDTVGRSDGRADRELEVDDVSAIPALELTSTEVEHRVVMGELELLVDRSSGALSLKRGGEVVLRSALGDGEFAAVAFTEAGAIQSVGYVGPGEELEGGGYAFSLSISQMGAGLGTLQVRGASADAFRVTLEPYEPLSESYGLSFSLASAGHWYGQGQLTRERNGREKQFHETSQHFPLDSGSYERPVLTADEGTNVVSPLWLTQSGVAVFVDAFSYMNISFNRDGNGIFKMHLIPREGETELDVYLFALDSTVEAYRAWVGHGFERRPLLPVGKRPSDELFTRPIWTTWAAYKAKIDEEKVYEFAKQIHDRGYEASYIEIDDMWTPKYGMLSFDEKKFPDAAGLVGKIKAMGYKVSLWIPPFVNFDTSAFNNGRKAKAFVGSKDEEVEYPPKIGWWTSAGLPIAGIIDFTGEAGWNWWSGEVNTIVDTYGVDGFKYDAGETQFLPKDALFASPVPENSYPDYYARWAVENHGVEVRAGWFAQDVPIAFRQFDKESSWGLDNGLASVLTQALAMGLIGYPFILPDMVGGNEYEFKADEELFLRWVELNTWLPMVQFSLLPWRGGYGEVVNETTKAYMDFRATLNDYILALADEAASGQMPMVRPLFFSFPGDEKSYAIGDQFMFGELYLVAPVLTRGAVARDVYLPPGRWIPVEMPSGSPGEPVDGPKVLEQWPAPLGKIPVFRRAE